MDIKKILEYQEKDFEVIKLERVVENNENKRTYEKMREIVKNAQNRSTTLDNEASSLLNEYNTLKKQYDDNLKSCGAILNKNLDKISDDDLENLNGAANDIMDNIAILEKKLMYLAERFNAILNEYNSTKKSYNDAKDKYAISKEAYDKEIEKIMPELEAKREEIKKLEKGVDAEILAKYKQRRADKIYPVFVKLKDKACGGCRMEIPSASIQKLKEKGFLECEHCRRIIYSE